LKEVAVGSKDDSIFLVFEYSLIDVGCLVDRMRINYDEMSIGEIKCIVLQILNGVSHLHEKFIMHRDLKLSNLLIGKDGIIKIADFGLARSFGKNLCPYLTTREQPNGSYTQNVVTLWYRAPEVLLGKDKYDCAIDVW
jgi:serine/threonine protein kinase